MTKPFNDKNTFLLVAGTFFIMSNFHANADSTSFSPPPVTPSPLTQVERADSSEAGVVDYDTSTYELVRKDTVRIPIPPSGGSGGGSTNGDWPITLPSDGGGWVGGESEEDWDLKYKYCTHTKIPGGSCGWSGSTLKCDEVEIGVVKLAVARQYYMVDDGTGRQVPIAERTCVAKYVSRNVYSDTMYGVDMVYDRYDNHPDLVDEGGKNWGNYSYKTSGYNCSHSTTFYLPSVTKLREICGW